MEMMAVMPVKRGEALVMTGCRDGVGEDSSAALEVQAGGKQVALRLRLIPRCEAGAQGSEEAPGKPRRK